MGADSLGYLTLEGLRRCGTRLKHGFCDACFSDEYPVAPSEEGPPPQLSLFRRSTPKMPEPGRGRLDLAGLVRAADEGSIHTVVTALPDLFGRLVGKRINVRFFLDSVAAGGMHVCDYLLACDMEMDPTPGYAFSSWESGYGDLHALPDLGTLRRAAWQGGAAIVLCDAFAGERRADRGLAAADPAAPARAARRARSLREDGQRARVLPAARRLRGRRREGYRNLVPTQHYVEDYHILSGTRVEDVIARSALTSTRRRSTSSSARASGGPGSTRSTCAMPKRSRWRTGT